MEMLRRHNRGLHGWGAVRGGLQVTTSPDKSGLLITPGSAVDNLGRQIVLDGDAVLFFQNNDQQLKWSADASAYALSSKDVAAAAGVTGNPLDIYLTITFQESESDDPEDHYPPPGGAVDVTRMRQTPLLKVEKAPPDDGSSVKLARVNVDVGGNLGAPDLSVRQQAGCFGPLSLTSADGTPQLGIDYDPQSDALRVRARTQDAPALDATHLSVKRDTGNVGVGTTPSAARLSIYSDPGADYKGVLTEYTVGGPYKLSLRFSSPGRDMVSYHFDLANNFGITFPDFLVFDRGNVGIGTPTPNSKLQVNGGADTSLIIGDRAKSGSVGLQFLGTGYKHAGLRFDGDNVIVENAGNSYVPSSWYSSTNPMNFIVRNGKLGIGTSPDSNLHLNVPISTSAVSAMSVDVQSFSTAQNAQASHFFRVRDIGAKSTPFYIRGDGWVGVGTTSPLGPLSVGDASVDGSDGYIVLGKRAGGGTRQYRIGFDKDFNFVIGDYGYSNAAAAWTSPFAMNYSAPSNSLYINDKGNVGIATPAPRAMLDVGETSLQTVKSILARMSEGNVQGVGTCLGVKAYNTQVDPTSKDKSFALEHYFYGNLNSAINFHRGSSATGGFMTFGTNDGSERMRLDDSGLHVTAKITIGDWTLECRKDNKWNSPRSSLYITYQSTDVARFGVVQDMLQIYPIDTNLVPHGYFYWNKDGVDGKAS